MAIPVTLEDAKRQLRLAGETLDAERTTEITGFIKDAAAWVERYTGHILVAADVTERFRSFDRLQLRAWPVKHDAAIGIGYSPPGGASTNLYGARIATTARPAILVPAAGTQWPTATDVIVMVRAGYEANDIVPGNLRRAMLVLIAAYDADREGGEVLAKAEAAARLLCRDFRARAL